MISKFISSKIGRIILSVIWALGLSTIFRKACKSRDCIIIKGPKRKQVENKVFIYENKCYQFKPEITKCN